MAPRGFKFRDLAQAEKDSKAEDTEDETNGETYLDQKFGKPKFEIIQHVCSVFGGRLFTFALSTALAWAVRL
jgi:hypothetical protein